MRILVPGILTTWSKEIECPDCKAQLEVYLGDLVYSRRDGAWTMCPECGCQLLLGEQDLTRQMIKLVERREHRQ